MRLLIWILLISVIFLSEEKCNATIFFNNWSSLNLKLHAVHVNYKKNEESRDSISNYQAEQSDFLDRCYKKINRYKAVRIGGVPALLFAQGALTWNAREEIHDMRQRYMPDFESHYDDYLQYGPSVIVYGLNLAGVKGKHTIGRATVNHAYSAAIMAVLVNTLKYTTHVLRPDGSSYNSFPSGHTATAFNSATFLHKEYGQYRDPRYSILGYSMAVATGIGRQTNNRHWISDVLVGAGIGILSGELGHLLADKIHGDWGVRSKGKNRYSKTPVNPSFALMKIGAAIPLDVSEERNIAKVGSTIGNEAAWFFNKNFGIGGQLSFISYGFTQSSVEIGFVGFEDYFEDEIEFQTLGSSYLMVGPYSFFSINNFWAISSKFNFGFSKGAKGRAISDVRYEYQTDLGKEQAVMEFYPGYSFGFATDVSIIRKLSRTLNLKAYMEYFYSNPYMNYRQVESVDVDNGKLAFGEWKSHGRLHSNSIVYGLSIIALLW